MFATKGAECASTVLTWASTPAAAGPRQMSQLRSKAQNLAPASTLLASNVAYFPSKTGAAPPTFPPPPMVILAVMGGQSYPAGGEGPGWDLPSLEVQ